MQADFFGGVPSERTQKFIAYCDGACKGNPGRGGWGYSLRGAVSGAIVKEDCGGNPLTTNNQMELQAAIETLRAVPAGSVITVVTDSQYVVKGLSEWLPGWKRKDWQTADKKPVKNVELWRELDALATARKVTMEWVKGHAGHPGNERADALSNEGVAKA